MKREIFLAFTHIKKHIDLSFLDERKVLIKLFVKGKPQPNGNGLSRVNTARFYLKEELPDDYNLRIDTMIEAVGGEKMVKKLVAKYEAKYSDIVLYIPCRTSDLDEEGTISCGTMQKLCKLKLGIQFLFI